MTKPSYISTYKTWKRSLLPGRQIGKSLSSTYGYAVDPLPITVPEVKEMVDKLIDGTEPFLVWMDVVGHDAAKARASKLFPLILQSLSSLEPESVSKDKWLDVRARILLTVGDLCLDHNILTHSGTRACLNIALSDLSSGWRGSCADDSSANLRYSMALGIMIAKLSCRLKFSKDYKACSKEQEEALARELKRLKP